MDEAPGITIVGRSNKVGLDRDAELIAGALAGSNHVTSFRNYRDRPLLAPVAQRAGDSAATIFLERIFPRWRNAAEVNLLVPNQERFPRRQVRLLRHVDHILAKTRHAVDVFGDLGCDVSLIGFTSRDRFDPDVDKDYGAAFHLAGRNNLKGTDALLDVWSRHPEWPPLLVVQHRKQPPSGLPNNVHLLHTFVDDGQLRVLQNRCGIHVFPSLAEGWGHALVEGLSCQAVVITTDAPPMNEIVDPTRGMCVPYRSASPRHLGTSFHVDEEALEASIQQALNLPSEASRSLGGRGRDWFLDNDAHFRRHFPEVIDQLLPPERSTS